MAGATSGTCIMFWGSAGLNVTLALLESSGDVGTYTVLLPHLFRICRSFLSESYWFYLIL